MACCDLCKKQVAFSELSELRNAFKIKDVDCICKECDRWISNRKFDIRYVKRQMIIKRNRVNRGTWWSRLWERIKFNVRTKT